jgi:hypothetical protein
MRRSAAVAATLATGVLFADSAAAAPPPLAGEVLSAHTGYAGPIAGVCTTNPDGSTGYSLDVAGTASGPYPGTFTEHIQVTIGPPSAVLSLGRFPDGYNAGPGPDDYVPAGQLLSLTAGFTIDSAAGDVTGTKSVTAAVPTDAAHAGTCREWNMESTPSFGTVTGAYRDVRVFGTAYSAKITTAEGSFRVTGTADLQARQGKASNQGGLLFDVSDFGEKFDASDGDGDGPGPPSGGNIPPGCTVDALKADPDIARVLKVATRGLKAWWRERASPVRFVASGICGRVTVRIRGNRPGRKPILLARVSTTLSGTNRQLLKLDLTPKGRRFRLRGTKLRAKAVVRITDAAGETLRYSRRMKLSVPSS